MLEIPNSSLLSTDSVGVKVVETPAGGLKTTLTTSRLVLRSMCRADDKDIFSLYSSPKVMTRFAEGTPRTSKWVTQAVDRWSTRWESGNPFSAFSIFHRSSGDFVGVAVMGHGNGPGEAELAGLSHLRYWGQGLGREACSAVVHGWAPETVRRGYRLEGALLGCIVGTARSDNPASSALMRGVGMVRSETINKWGQMRDVYRYNVAAPALMGISAGTCAARFTQKSEDASPERLANEEANGK